MKPQVLLFYKYVTIEDPEALKMSVRSFAERHQLLGRILVAEEGINGTVEGTSENTEAFALDLLADPRLSDMNIKRSEGTGESFNKLCVKVRDEIVGTHFPKHVDPRVRTAPRLSAEELRSWYEEGKDFVVVDMVTSRTLLIQDWVIHAIFLKHSRSLRPSRRRPYSPYVRVVYAARRCLRSYSRTVLKMCISSRTVCTATWRNILGRISRVPSIPLISVSPWTLVGTVV